MFWSSLTSQERNFKYFFEIVGNKQEVLNCVFLHRSSIGIVFLYPSHQLNSTIVTSRRVQFETLGRRLLFGWTLPMESVLLVL